MCYLVLVQAKGNGLPNRAYQHTAGSYRQRRRSCSGRAPQPRGTAIGARPVVLPCPVQGGTGSARGGSADQRLGAPLGEGKTSTSIRASFRVHVHIVYIVHISGISSCLFCALPSNAPPVEAASHTCGAPPRTLNTYSQTGALVRPALSAGPRGTALGVPRRQVRCGMRHYVEACGMQPSSAKHAIITTSVRCSSDTRTLAHLASDLLDV